MAGHKFPRAVLENIQRERLDLGEKKHKDYSSAIDTLGLSGVNGIAVRLLDKVGRALSLTKANASDINFESIRDTFIDIGNYADYAVAMIDGKWHGEN